MTPEPISEMRRQCRMCDDRGSYGIPGKKCDFCGMYKLCEEFKRLPPEPPDCPQHIKDMLDDWRAWNGGGPFVQSGETARLLAIYAAIGAAIAEANLERRVSP